MADIQRATYLLTGATGFLGYHVLDALLRRQPHGQILVLVRKAAEWSDLVAQYQADGCVDLGRVAVIEGGVLGDDAWLRDSRLQNVDKIFHLAALVRHSRSKPQDIYDTNIEGTLRIVRLAGRLNLERGNAKQPVRIVFVSTSGTVGCSTSPDAAPDEDAPYCENRVASWPYYDSKVQAEKKARGLAAELGVQLVVIRPPVLLGPGDFRYRSTGTVIKFLMQKFSFLLQGGMHFIDIRDAAAAIVAAMHHPAARPVYHLAGTASTLTEFFQMLRDVSGVPLPKRTLPTPLALALAQAAERTSDALGRKKSPLPDPVVIEMASHYWGLKSRFAQSELDYESRPGRQTLADTVSWLRDHHPDLRKQRK